jgi:pyruvate kinase
MIRTKIVATIGPASRPPEILRKLIETGVDVFRLNFSHGTHEEHEAVLKDIRAISRELGTEVAVLQDLCGPKVRLGEIPGDVIDCNLGEHFWLVIERTGDDPHELTCSYEELPRDLRAGETVLFADGTVVMTVLRASGGRAELEVTLPGRLRSRQGINVPTSEIAVDPLTEKDLADLDWTAKHVDDIQYVGLSFVRAVEDVAGLRRELRTRRIDARIVAKIEKRSAVLGLNGIISSADALMIARGDLGVELDVSKVPAIQKEVIALSNQAHRPVITATQMLNSMEHSSRPTRAEASDVFNAVIDGTDAVMLSGETAVGRYPVEAVETMRRICAEAESFQSAEAKRKKAEGPAPLSGLVQPITEAIVDSACTAAIRLSAPVIVVSTSSGRTALALSNRRPAATILALTPSVETARALELCWGVTPLVVESRSVEHEIQAATGWAKKTGVVRPGSHVVLVRGEVPGDISSRTVTARRLK